MVAALISNGTEAHIYLELFSRSPQCPSPRPIWDPHTLSRKRVCPPPRTKKGLGHTRLRVRGWVGPNSDDSRKSLGLCLLCGYKF
jgi:hypothetical protein